MPSIKQKHVPITRLSEDRLQDFKLGFRGEVIQPGDRKYKEARQVYNAMIDRYPSLVAYCTGAADVIRALNVAREQHLDIAIRSGGHNGAGLGVCDGGICIDLSRMKGIRVNAKNRSVRVEAGCTWGEVDHATHAFGLAVPSGIISTTGVAGLTLGGGHGHLTRKYGLTIDNLLEADVVLANGQLVTASEQEHQDLFWAIRGGGGNFGIVTSFVFRLHPVSNVVAGPMLWDLEQTPTILKWYREYILSAPEELNGFFAVMSVPPAPPFPEAHYLKKVCGILWCHCGRPDDAAELLKGIREIAPPLFEHIGEVPYPAIQGAFDALYPKGDHWYWRGDFVKEIPDEAVELHMQFGRELPSIQSSMHLYPVDGAVNRVGKNDTAFSFREANWSQVIVGVDPDPANKERITQWTKRYWEALHPYSMGGAYVNFLMDEGQDRVQATYRDNYARLAQIKQLYDPANLFHINQNIKPQRMVESQ